MSSTSSDGRASALASLCREGAARRSVRVALLSVILLALASPAVATPSASVRRVINVGGPSVTRRLALTASGGLSSLSFRSRSASLPVGEIQSGEFRVVVRDDASGVVSELTGESGWELVSEDHQPADERGASAVTLELDSQRLPLRATLRYETFEGSPVVRTILGVTNAGEAPLTVLAIESAFLRFQAGASESRLFWVPNFTWEHPLRALVPVEEVLPQGGERRVVTGAYGEASAWFALKSGRGGLFGGWEWSGTGELRFGVEGDTVTVSMGLSPEVFRRALEPGETFTAPPAFLGVYSGDWDDAGFATRTFVDAHIAPPVPGPDFPPVGFNTWGYGEAIDQALVHELVDQSADLGSELFTLDAGWMDRLGDWTPRFGDFDGGIAAIADHVHARGMKFGLWMAFGSVDPGSRVAREHPELLARRSGQTIGGDFGSVALCLASPAARDWVLSELDRVIGDYHVDWLVHDFQVIVRCDAPGHGHQATDGDFATTAGYYAILEELRVRHPSLLLENCWNGGGTLDFGMVRRHDTSAISDAYDAVSNRKAVHGASYFLPPRYIDKYVGDDHTAPSHRLLSAMTGGPLFLMGRLGDWTPETRRTTAQAVSSFKELRPILREGRIYHLSKSPGLEGWDAVMTSDARTGTGALFGFTGESALSDGFVVRTKGLSPFALYDVGIGLGIESAYTWVKGGGELRRDGLHVMIVAPRDAAMVLLDKRPNR